MPNNENNNFTNNSNPGFDNSLNNLGEQPTMQPQQPIIEIPQTYYEKLEKEKAEEEASAQAANPQPVNPENKISKSFLPISLLTAVITFGLLYLTININEIILLGIPAYIVLLSIIFAIKEKKESCFPSAVVTGGMISAVISFVLSMVLEDMDLWTYYTVSSAVTAFLGLIVSKMLTKIFTDIKNIKAIQTIVYILFFALLIGGPIFAYKKYPTEFYRIVFYQKKEVVATNYEDFVIKTLENRYDVSFTCNFSPSEKLTTGKRSLPVKENFKNEKNELMAKLSCVDENDNLLYVTTIAYNEGGTQYTVIDNFMDVLYFNEIKAEIAKKVQNVTSANEVIVYLFPKENCTFIGDCADCDEYYKVYQKENDSTHRYEVSSKLDYSKNIGLTNEEFIKKHINTNNYKVLITIRGVFNKNTFDFNQSVQKVLEELNSTGIKNTSGYEIKYTNYSEGAYEIEIHKTKGNTSSTKKFE